MPIRITGMSYLNLTVQNLTLSGLPSCKVLRQIRIETHHAYNSGIAGTALVLRRPEEGYGPVL
jgi:hypothetical protein